MYIWTIREILGPCRWGARVMEYASLNSNSSCIYNSVQDPGIKTEWARNPKKGWNYADHIGEATKEVTAI